MRIVIDMQGAQTESRFRGIGRYSLSLAQAIVRNRGGHEVLLALNGLFQDTIEPLRAAFDGLLPQENIRVWHAPGPVREMASSNACRREVAELIREAFLASLKPDVIHISSLFEGYIDDAMTSIGRFDRHTPVSVSLYDLIPLLNPDHYLKPNPVYAQYYRRKIAHLREASLYLAISEFSRQEGLAHLEAAGERVVNVSTAIDPRFQVLHIEDDAAAQLRHKFGLNRPFVLYTGGADERKNLPRLIQAFAALPASLRQRHQLLLAGKVSQGDLALLKRQAQMVRLGPDELCFTGYVSDEELIQLYNLCELFVFPSWHEGFGLPALEAMACGAPAIGANASSLPEVLGWSEALFDPLDVTAISSRMAKALEDDQFRALLRVNGLERTKLFSWDQTARRAIEAFEGACSADRHIDLRPDYSALVGAIAKVSSTFSDEELMAIASGVSRIQFEARPRQLLVDVSELVQRDARTGVQRVTRSILNELLDRPPEGFAVRPVFASTELEGFYYAQTFTARFQGGAPCGSDEPIDYFPGDVFLGLDLQHHTTKAQADYLSKMRDEGVGVFFVVYDLLPVLLPHCWPREHSLDRVHHEWLSVLSRFDGAACISRAVADELADWQRIHVTQRLRPFKIGWFHLGADMANSVPSLGLPGDAPRVLTELGRRPSFLAVGTIEPRKCQAQVLRAFELLWAEGVDANLVVVGKQGWLVEDLMSRFRNHLELGKRLFWLDGISDEYLERIYAASTCLIAASEGEGFGLPLIEAAQHGVPIIARDIPVFREVAEQCAFYFSGQGPDELAGAVRNWLALQQKGQHPASDALPWRSWEESAEALLSIIISEDR